MGLFSGAGDLMRRLQGIDKSARDAEESSSQHSYKSKGERPTSEVDVNPGNVIRGRATEESTRKGLAESLQREKNERRLQTLKDEVADATKLMNETPAGQKEIARLGMEAMTAVEQANLVIEPKEKITELAAELARRGYEKKLKTDEAFSAAFRQADKQEKPDKKERVA